MIRAFVIAALAVGMCAGWTAQASDRWGMPAWVTQGDELLSDRHRRSAMSDLSAIYDLKLMPESDLSGVGHLMEMHRLLEVGPGKSLPGIKRLTTKVLLALPLLKRGNALELGLRSEQDIVMTVGRRMVIRKFGKSQPIRPPEGTIAVDLHVHTCASADSLATASDMLLSAAAKGLAGIAVTDHDSFEGARRAVQAAQDLKAQGKLPRDFLVAPGEEISSSDGHIVGLFLKSEIPGGKSAEWTVQAIHDQGGLAIAAHPMLPHSLRDLAVALPFDAVETESAAERLHYAITPGENHKRRADFYAALTKPRIGSSDSHDPESMAECYTLADCAPTLEALRAAILAGKTVPVAPVPEADRKSLTHHPFLRILAAYRCITDLSPLVRKLTGSDDISLSILPRPVLRYSRKF